MKKIDLQANILFISSYPLPLEKGSNQHAFFYLKALAKEHHVHCLFFKQEPRLSDAEASQHTSLFSKIGLEDVHVIDCVSVKIINKIKKRIKSNISFPYSYAQNFDSRTNRDLFKKLVSDNKIDIVHIESLHYARFMWHLPDHVKKVFVYHDLHHKIFFEQAKFVCKPHDKLESILCGIKVLFFQHMINKKSDLTLFLNSHEMAFSPHRSVHVPHVVNPDIAYRLPEQHRDIIKFFFLGGYNHPPNRVAMRMIIDKILPELSASFDCDWEFHIIGKGTEKYKPLIEQNGLGGNVRFRGFVKDINCVFDDMDIALFPIPYGGGIKTKVIETMAAGIPVITTDNGVFGLNELKGDCINVCNTPQEIVNALARLMMDDKLRVRQSKAAKSYIEQHHSYDSMQIKLSRAYKRIF